jgi:hypothetical protein
MSGRSTTSKFTVSPRNPVGRAIGSAMIRSIQSLFVGYHRLFVLLDEFLDGCSLKGSHVHGRSRKFESALSPCLERVLRCSPVTPWTGSKPQQHRFPLLGGELQRV